jgi:hypothetical protein
LSLQRDSGGAAKGLKHLADIEQRVGALRVPPAYAGEYYTLRIHIGLVRQQLEARLKERGA